jgi:hypothetical protein
MSDVQSGPYDIGRRCPNFVKGNCRSSMERARFR